MFNLDDIVKDYIIYIDTCGLMNDKGDILFNVLPNLLVKYKKQVRILASVVKEVNKHLKNHHTKHDAFKAKKTIELLIDKKLVIFKGENSDPYLADATFQMVLTKFRMNYNLCFITTDSGLASDLINISNSKSVTSKKRVLILSNQTGVLESWVDIFEKWKSNKNKINTKTRIQSKKLNSNSSIDKFNLRQRPTTEIESLLKIINIPNENDIVLTKKFGSLKLKKQIASGGEGSVYTIDKNSSFVCKIYKAERLTNLRQKKLELMATKQLNCDGICWPKDIIYNQQNQFVGYIMDKAEGIDLGKTIFIKPKFLKEFPGWDRKNLANLCLTILDKMKYLHDRNIILGDINPFNIMIKNDKTVYFVDTDSYQIEQYPCPVGTVTYTPPELHKLKKKYNEYLRTFEHEYFALATLLFMILLPGKAPYDQIGGDSIIEGIKEMDFSYPLGEKSNKKAPKGLWRFMWSHLTFDLKYAFYNTFNKEKELDSRNGLHRLSNYFANNKRLNCNEWISLITFYRDTFLLNNSASCEIYPDNFKLLNPVNEICQICHKNKSFEKDFIDKCNATGKSIICITCHEMQDFHSKSNTFNKPNLSRNTGRNYQRKYTIKTCLSCNGIGKISCQLCNGRGRITKTVYVNCTTCKGNGYISTFFGLFKNVCPDCYGKKQISKKQEHKCSKCNGSGKIICYNCNGKGKT